MSDPLLDRVHAIVTAVVGSRRAIPEAGPQTPLGEKGYWLDSVDVLEVVMACEHEFGIELADKDDLTSETLATVGTLAELIQRKLR